MRRLQVRLALLAVAALLVLAAVAPATAAARTHRLGAGTATLSLDPTETGLFLQAGIPPYPIFPARISWGTSSAVVRMPITGGTWTTGAGAHGTFLLRGGLAYVAQGTTNFLILNLKAWHVGVNTSNGISVSANGTRTPNFFDDKLPVSSIVTIHGQKFAKVTDLPLFFNATSVSAINGEFGSAPNPGETFGLITVLARLKS